MFLKMISIRTEEHFDSFFEKYNFARASITVNVTSIVLQRIINESSMKHQ